MFNLKKIVNMVLPVFLGAGIAKWFSENMFFSNGVFHWRGVEVKKNNYEKEYFNIYNYRPSAGIIEIKKKIEGFRNIAYQNKADKITVGTGLTYFSDGTKPIKGRYYSTEFLDKELIKVSKTYIDKAVRIAKSSIAYKPTERMLDALYYLCFNGFTENRIKSWLILGSKNEKVMAQWLFSPDGIGRVFLKKHHFFVGIVKARLYLANFLVGNEYNKGEAELLRQFPVINGKYDGVGAVKLYLSGKVKFPQF